MRGHRVASMAKCKGDKAKKEFSVDNSIELNLIRDKYAEQLTTEDNKKILPAFLGWVAKQKGYYDGKHKAYLQHDTSMDYLQTIVRRFKTKNPIPKPTSRLIDLFNTKSYREGWVNKKHVSHIMKYINLYSMQVSKLFDHTICPDEDNYSSIDRDVDKYESYRSLQNELVNHINDYRIGYSTMIFILKHFENKEYYKYRNILLPLLFTVCRQPFIEALIESREDIDVLVEGGNDITLFDFSYKIDKNSQFFD